MAEIKLALFTHRVNEQSLAPVHYNRVLMAAISGQIPAVLRGGRWHVDDKAVQSAIEYFARQKAGRRAA